MNPFNVKFIFYSHFKKNINQKLIKKDSIILIKITRMLFICVQKRRFLNL